jgi:hypoxanthine phosphoribosyltransferase
MDLTNKEYNSRVAKICRSIAISNWRPDYIVGLTRGGLIPAVMISHYFDIPMYALHVTSKPETNESNLWMAEDAFGYEYGKPEVTARKKILIVDDINDTGKTINWLIEDWQSSCLPKDPSWKDVWNHNVKFAVVYDNVSSKSHVTIDFSGEEITKSKKEWIVFPYERWWE